MTELATRLATVEPARVEDPLETIRPLGRRAVAIVTSAIVVAIVIAMPWSPIRKYFESTAETDFSIHAGVAQNTAEKGIYVPHFLWHAIVVAVHAVRPSMSWMDASLLVVIASYALQGAAIAWMLTTFVGEPRRAMEAIGVVVITLLLAVAAPVTVFTWREEELYFGYLNMESYRSPTHALLKPLALVAFALTAKLFANTASRREHVVLAVAVMLSALAKPSLTICLVPATVVLGLWFGMRRQPFHRGPLLGAVLVPSVAILAWQYLLYFGGEGSSAIIFAPLVVMAHYATGLFPKFLLSILLPLTVLLLYRRQAFTDSTLQLAWVLFAFAAGYTYLLAETRETMAGNFVWAGQIGTYLLFMASAVFLLREWTGRWRSVLCGVAGGLHIVCGILFFFFAL